VKILTTGINSGLGRCIYEDIRCLGLGRNTSIEEIERIKNDGVETIIHCAFNSNSQVNLNSLYQYLQDNVLLTKELISFPHKKFIFISSVDVYPKDVNLHLEDENIDMSAVNSIYGITKLMSESLVKKYCENYLILRASAMLGKYSRRNSLIRMIEDTECELTLSYNSRFNYILHSDILDFIKFSISHDIKGTLNVVSSENITLLEVADMLKKTIRFGKYFYDVGNINNSRISSVFPAFKKSSREIIFEFMRSKR